MAALAPHFHRRIEAIADHVDTVPGTEDVVGNGLEALLPADFHVKFVARPFHRVVGLFQQPLTATQGEAGGLAEV
ncbi:hypothetical protein D3C86_2178710 [compost metagenome]